MIRGLLLVLVLCSVAEAYPRFTRAKYPRFSKPETKTVQPPAPPASTCPGGNCPGTTTPRRGLLFWR